MRFCSLIIILFLCTSVYAHPAGNTDTVLERIRHISNDSLRLDTLYKYIVKLEDENPKEAVAAGKVFLQDAQSLGRMKEVAMANNVIGESYELMADCAHSLEYYLAALRIHKDLKLYSMQISDMLGVSRVYDMTGDLASQKKYIEEAMAVGNEHGNDEKVNRKRPVILDYRATIYKKEGKYDSAIKLYNEAIIMAQNNHDTTHQMSSLCNLAIALKSDKNYAASLAAYHSALALIDTNKDLYALAVINDNMGILFYQTGDLQRAEQYLQKAVALAHKLNMIDVLRDAYEMLTKVYQKEKRYSEALDYSLMWSAVKDSVLSGEKSQAIAQWQTKFDTEAKDKQIADQKKELEYNRKINLSLALSTTLFLLLGIIVYRNYKVQKKYIALITREKKRSEDLLLNILPAEVAEELKDTGSTPARHFDNVTVLFTDFVNFTQASERMNPQQLIDELHYCFKAFDDIIDKYNIEKIKTIGDSYLAVSGLPVTDSQHAEHIINAALEINEFVRKRRAQLGTATFEVRIGVHTGSVVAGIVGVKKFSYDIWGDTVNTAARMEQTSEAGKINISQTTWELVKDKFPCTYRGEVEAKNKGLLKMYFVG